MSLLETIWRLFVAPGIRTTRSSEKLCDPVPPTFYFCQGWCLSYPGLLSSRHLSVSCWKGASLSRTEPSAHSSGNGSTPSPHCLFSWSFIALSPFLIPYFLVDICFPPSSMRAGETLLILLNITHPVPSTVSDPLHKLLKGFFGWWMKKWMQAHWKTRETWKMQFKTWFVRGIE